MLFCHLVITVCACTFVTCTLIKINQSIKLSTRLFTPAWAWLSALKKIHIRCKMVSFFTCCQTAVNVSLSHGCECAWSHSQACSLDAGSLSGNRKFCLLVGPSLYHTLILCPNGCAYHRTAATLPSAHVSAPTGERRERRVHIVAAARLQHVYINSFRVGNRLMGELSLGRIVWGRDVHEAKRSWGEMSFHGPMGRNVRGAKSPDTFFNISQPIEL